MLLLLSSVLYIIFHFHIFSNYFKDWSFAYKFMFNHHSKDIINLSNLFKQINDKILHQKLYREVYFPSLYAQYNILTGVLIKRGKGIGKLNKYLQLSTLYFHLKSSNLIMKTRDTYDYYFKGLI